MRILINEGEHGSVPGPGQKWVISEYVLLWKEEGGVDVFVTKVPPEVYEAKAFSLEEIEGTPVPTEYYRIRYKAGWTLFEGTLEDRHYVKEGCLRDYWPDEPEEDWPATELHDEIEIYEKLKFHPHPNIVKYHGVQVKNGYIVGIILEKFDVMIYRALGSPRRPSHILDLEVVMKELTSAVEHLHSIGIVHCDITPLNLGVDIEGYVVVFDFDCAFPIGARRYGKIYNGCWANTPEILEAELACVEIDYECIKLTKEALLEYPQQFALAPAPNTSTA